MADVLPTPYAVTWNYSGSSTGYTPANVTALLVSRLPEISNPQTVTIPAGQFAPYQIQATRAMTYAAEGLPAGFSVCSATGLITATTSMTPGTTFTVTLIAQNFIGETRRMVTFNVPATAASSLDESYPPV